MHSKLKKDWVDKMFLAVGTLKRQNFRNTLYTDTL